MVVAGVVFAGRVGIEFAGLDGRYRRKRLEEGRRSRIHRDVAGHTDRDAVLQSERNHVHVVRCRGGEPAVVYVAREARLGVVRWDGGRITEGWSKAVGGSGAPACTIVVVVAAVIVVHIQAPPNRSIGSIELVVAVSQ